MENKTKLLAVYGTLKRDKSLYQYWLQDKSKYLGNSTIKGTMQLVGNGRYPYLFDWGDKSYDIEIFEVNIDSYKDLCIMECSAGYYEDVIETPFGKANIFFTEKEYFSEEKEIIMNF